MKSAVLSHSSATLAAVALCSVLLPMHAAAQTAPPSSASSSAINARYLAANCANCHGTAGVSAGPMPSLSGQNATYLAEQMRQFRDGKRPATIMHQLAKGYSDEQIAAIAAHFAAQKK